VHISFAHTARGNTGFTTAFAEKMPLGYATVGTALQQTSVKTHSVEITLEPVRVRPLTVNKPLKAVSSAPLPTWI